MDSHDPTKALDRPGSGPHTCIVPLPWCGLVKPRVCGIARLLLILAVGACAAGNRGDPQTLTVLYPGDERILGPYWEMPAKFLMFLPLARYGADGELKGVLARRWEHTPDYRTWTVYLRTDVRWHDGVPFTARDVEFTMGLFTHPEVLWEPSGAMDLQVLDDSTYTVTLNRPGDSPVDTWRVFYPRHLLDTLPPGEFQNWEFWARPVGNGPYRYVRHVPKTMLLLAANRDYAPGRSAVDSVVLKFAPSGASGLTELLSGSVDALGWVTGMDVIRLRDDPRVRLYYEIGSAMRGIVWKSSDARFTDPRVRRALTLAINRRELHAILNYPAETPLADGPYTESRFRRRELLEPLPYDPAEAGRLLDEAGWLERDGVRQRGGRALRFTLLVPSEAAEVGVYVQDQLARVGVRAEVSTVDLNVIRQRTRSGAFEAVLAWLDQRSQARLFGLDGVSGYRNARVAALYDSLAVTVDLTQREVMFEELYQIIRSEQPATYLFPGVTHFAAPVWLRGLSSPHRADPLVHMEHLWIEGR